MKEAEKRKDLFSASWYNIRGINLPPGAAEQKPVVHYSEHGHE